MVEAMKKWKIDRIIGIATLITSLAALVLVLKKPAPVAKPQTPAQAAANAQSFQEKIAQLETAAPQAQLNTLSQSSEPQQPVIPQETPSAQAQVHLTSDEVTAALAQAAGALPAAA